MINLSSSLSTVAGLSTHLVLSLSPVTHSHSLTATLSSSGAAHPLSVIILYLIIVYLPLVYESGVMQGMLLRQKAAYVTRQGVHTYRLACVQYAYRTSTDCDM